MSIEDIGSIQANNAEAVMLVEQAIDANGIDDPTAVIKSIVIDSETSVGDKVDALGIASSEVASIDSRAVRREFIIRAVRTDHRRRQRHHPPISHWY